MREKTGHSTEIVHLSLPRGQAAAKEQFRRAERVVLAFPLYTDAMPGQVMELFEALEEFSGRSENPPIAFLVQSGFPEAGQCRAVEHWLELFAKRLGARHLGTIVKGGVEGIQAMPPWMTRRLLRGIEELGHSLGSTGRFDPKALRKLAGGLDEPLENSAAQARHSAWGDALLEPPPQGQRRLHPTLRSAIRKYRLADTLCHLLSHQAAQAHLKSHPQGRQRNVNERIRHDGRRCKERTDLARSDPLLSRTSDGFRPELTPRVISKQPHGGQCG